MTRTFRYKNWLKISILVIWALFLALACYFLLTEDLEIGFLHLSFAAFFSIGVYDAFRYKIEIDKSAITKQSSIRTRSLALAEIESYKISSQGLFLFPKKNEHKAISISRSIDGYGDLAFWFMERYPDKNLQDYMSEEQEILTDIKYGYNKEEREQNLKQAFKKAKFLNSITWISVALGLFYPKPYEYVISILIILPLIAFFLVVYSKGLVGIGAIDNDSKESARPSVMTSVWMPGLILGARVLMDYNIYQCGNLIYWTLLAAFLIALVLTYVSSRLEKQTVVNLLVMGFVSLIFFWFYLFGVVLSANALLDTNKPEVYTSQVTHKYKSSGKVTTYHLELSAWGPLDLEENADVSKKVYNSIKIDQQVDIIYHKGYLNIPWYQIWNSGAE